VYKLNMSPKRNRYTIQWSVWRDITIRICVRPTEFYFQYNLVLKHMFIYLVFMKRSMFSPNRVLLEQKKIYALITHHTSPHGLYNQHVRSI